MHPSRRSVLSVPLAAALGVAATGATPASAAKTSQLNPQLDPQQSPVDLDPRRLLHGRPLPPLQVHYDRHAAVSLAYVSRDTADPGGCDVRDVEETEQAGVEPGAGWVMLAGTRYDLLQTHFHTPSEHTVDGRHTPMEQHFVHADTDGRLLVLGVLLLEGPTSEADQLLAELPDECSDTVPVADVDLRAMLPDRLAPVRYAGSLTTAPYSEDVQWFVVGTRTVSREGIQRFRTVFPDGDSREVQPLGDRRPVADPGAFGWLAQVASH